MTRGFGAWKACSAGVPTRAFAKGIGFQQRRRDFSKGDGISAKEMGFQQRASAGGDTRATTLPPRQQVHMNNRKAHGGLLHRVRFMSIK
jgi:hypothetical protein